MQYIKGKIASMILSSPLVFIMPSCVSLYGPPPSYYNCANDNHCRQFPEGKCNIQEGKDSSGEKGGYCSYPGYKMCYEPTDSPLIEYVPENEKCSWAKDDAQSDDGPITHRPTDSNSDSSSDK